MRHGFTLLELVLVLLLISVALAIASPNLRGFAAGSKLKNATRDVVSALEWARTQSASEGRIYRVRFDEQGYVVDALQDGTVARGGAAGASLSGQDQQGDQFAESQADLGRRVDWPEGVSAVVRKEQVAGTTAVSDPNTVEFYPDGRTEPGRVEIHRADEQMWVMATTPAERWHVASAAEMRGQ